MKRVSVVVPTYKRSGYLERCLLALLAQDFPAGDFEILIVDDAASEQTRQQVEEWSARMAVEGYTIRYLSTSKTAHGPAAARNLGWHTAQSEIIAFTDDDCIPEQRWLTSALAALEDDKEIAALSGRIVIPMSTSVTDYEYNAYQLTRSEFVTANCFYRRDTLLQIGGFDERFTAAWREDTDLYFSLLEHDLHTVAVPEVVVMHPLRPARWGISLFQQRKSMFNALLYKKHPVLYRQKVQARPPWHYYSILGALLVAIVAGIFGLWLLSLIALTAWLFMTLRFSLQRLRKTIHTPAHIAEMLLTSALIPPICIFWRVYGMLRFRVLFL
ncbi:MAG: glycosyltransferase [Ktedonobacteraceae bacterium]|nr:glycosyltransferase [Ktedonobacteraceae bacterium]